MWMIEAHPRSFDYILPEIDDCLIFAVEKPVNVMEISAQSSVKGEGNENLIFRLLPSRLFEFLRKWTVVPAASGAT